MILSKSCHNCSSCLPSSTGPSLEEKLFSSCDLTANKRAQVNFRARQALAELTPRTRVSVQYHSSSRARNWASSPEDLSAAFTVETVPEPPSASPVVAETQAPSSSGERRGSSDSSRHSLCLFRHAVQRLPLLSLQLSLSLLITKCFWRVKSKKKSNFICKNGVILFWIGAWMEHWYQWCTALYILPTNENPLLEPEYVTT